MHMYISIHTGVSSHRVPHHPGPPDRGEVSLQPASLHSSSRPPCFTAGLDSGSGYGR